VNYRRGLQRAYAVLAIGWIAAILFVTLSETPSATLSDADIAKLDSQPVVKEEHGPPPDPSRWESTQDHLTVVESRPLPTAPRNWLRIGALSFAPPLVGYAMLFYVIPWVYWGFKPSTQN